MHPPEPSVLLARGGPYGARGHSLDGHRIGPPKIGDVARRAGVSTATVSRTLTQPDSVKAETRRRVLEVVRELGYTPNAAARNLRAGKTRMVLVVVPKLANPYFVEVVRGIDRELSAHGYGLIVGDLDNSADKEAHLVELAYAGQLDGVIVMSGRMPRSAGRELDGAGVPIVSACVPLQHPAVGSVLIDDEAATRVQVGHLVSRGHRSLVYLSGASGNFNDAARYRGFRAAAAEAGIPEDRLMRIEGDYTFEAGAAAALVYLDLPSDRRPTGVVAASDEMAIGFMRTVRRHGVHVPEDVSVVGFDGIEFASYCEPTLTTIRQPRRGIGAMAARLLLARIAEPQGKAEHHVLATELMIGASTCPPPS